MNLFLVRNIPVRLSSRGRLLANFQSGVRLLSSSNDGKNTAVYNNGTVNKSDANKPALTVYPYKIDFDKLAADRAKKNAENAQAISTISKLPVNAIKPEFKILKTVENEIDAKKSDVETKVTSFSGIHAKNKNDGHKPAKNKSDVPKPAVEKQTTVDNKEKKKSKNDAVNSDKSKKEWKNQKISPKGDKNSSTKKTSALSDEKTSMTVLEGKIVRKATEIEKTASNTELPEKNIEKNREKDAAGKSTLLAMPVPTVAKAELKSIDKVAKAEIRPIETVEEAEKVTIKPIEWTESKPAQKQSSTSVLSTPVLSALSKPVEFCPIKPKVISTNYAKVAQGSEILSKSASGASLLEDSSREIFLRQCNLRSEFSTSPKHNSSSSSSSTPPPPPPPSSPSSSSSSSSQFVWIGAAAAILLGGGFYLTSSSKSEKVHQTTAEKKAEAPAAVPKPKVPLTSVDIPKEVPYLLIGGGTASFAAFRAIKSHDPKARVMVLSNEVETPYMRPPLSKELWLAAEATNKLNEKNAKTADTEALKFKQWNGVERSLYYEPNDFYIHPSKLLEEPNGGVAIVRGYTVDRIDVPNRVAILTDGTEIKYGKCLIATGSTPKNLSVFESAPAKLKERISLFKTIEDFANLKRHVDSAKSVAIVGGGFLGSELACALAKYGESKKLEINQVFHEKGNMGKVLPEFLSEWATDRVREEGVNVIPKTEVQDIALTDKNQVKLSLLSGESIVCDHVIVAVGSEPNVELGRKSGLEVDAVHGGYLVNAELAARNHVYVAGDAACFYDPQLGRRRVEHHDHAVVSGRLAGENMFGLNKPFTHQSMFWSDLGAKVGYEAIGVIDSALKTVSVFAVRNDTDETATIQPSVQAASNTNDAADKKEDFSKGVVFYLRDDKIVGIVLWNVFNRINTARAVIGQNQKYDDLNEVAKLFDIHT